MKDVDAPNLTKVVKAQDPMTLEEVGELLGCTRERVRQIEKKALAKMRRRLMLMGLKLEDVLPDQFSSHE
jgi:DNA-directed RNA polymerase sigma subunit (sigma70/sigma32)